MYMPSIECLYGTNATAFLLSYQLLLRTDLDTFVSPTFVSWWPKTTSIRGEQGYVLANTLAECTHLPLTGSTVVTVWVPTLCCVTSGMDVPRPRQMHSASRTETNSNARMRVCMRATAELEVH